MDIVLDIIDNKRSPSNTSSDDSLSDNSPHQHKLNKILNKLNLNGPSYYSYSSLVNYLLYGILIINDNIFKNGLYKISKKILKASNMPVYFADDTIFSQEVMHIEFTELKIFKITLNEAFIESKIHPCLWIETRLFSTLHTLSKFRRELKKSNIDYKEKSLEIVSILLGLKEMEL